MSCLSDEELRQRMRTETHVYCETVKTMLEMHQSRLTHHLMTSFSTTESDDVNTLDVRRYFLCCCTVNCELQWEFFVITSLCWLLPDNTLTVSLNTLHVGIGHWHRRSHGIFSGGRGCTFFLTKSVMSFFLPSLTWSYTTYIATTTFISSAGVTATRRRCGVSAILAPSTYLLISLHA